MTKRIVDSMNKLVLFANAMVSSPETMVAVAQMILPDVEKAESFRSFFHFMNRKTGGMSLIILQMKRANLDTHYPFIKHMGVQDRSTTGSHRISSHRWFPDPAQVEAQAYEVGQRAFEQIIQTKAK
jgi:hypothetical protein